MRTLSAVVVALLLASGSVMADGDVEYERFDTRSGDFLYIPMDRSCLESAGQTVPPSGLITLPGYRDDWEQAQQLAAIHCIARRLERIEQLLIIIAGAVKPPVDDWANRGGKSQIDP